MDERVRRPTKTLSIGEGAGAIELDVLRVVNGVKSIRPSDTIGLELCAAVVRDRRRTVASAPSW